MSSIALDTNAYSDLHKTGTWLPILRQADHVVLPLPVVGELRYGFLKGKKRTENEKTLTTFLGKSRTQIVCPDSETASCYAALVLQLTSQGTPIPINDVWIAAICLQHNLSLCTSDHHFDRIPQLSRSFE